MNGGSAIQVLSSVRFGRAASREKYQRIQGYVKAEGLDPQRLDPVCTEVTRESPVPLWSFLCNTLPDLRSQLGFVRRIKQKATSASQEMPYAASMPRSCTAW